jgi:putative GTP pyrophosphokinase
LEEDRLGYQSVHFIVKLSETRINLPEYKQYKNLMCEIQVRTVMQHAWAEIEHDIQYKSSITIPADLRRRFITLAGLLEVADHEFQTIQDLDAARQKESQTSVSKGNLNKVEITPSALKTYLDQRMGSDARVSNYSYEIMARRLKRIGFLDLSQVDECIKGYSDEKISHIFYDIRQGQLTRFDDLLLAGMGESYLQKSPLSTHVFYQDYIKRKIDKLKAGGVNVGSYSPSSEN